MSKNKITYDDNANSELLLSLINEENLSGEEVFNMFTDWHGTSLCTKDFMENLRDCEGYRLPNTDE